MDKNNPSEHAEKLNRISEKFAGCGKAITAIGDETRQRIIIALLECGCNGMRVGAITEKTHLSRPAVSHHLQILKDADVIDMRREGTRNYYFLDAGTEQWRSLLSLMQEINGLMDSVAKSRERKRLCSESD